MMSDPPLGVEGGGDALCNRRPSVPVDDGGDEGE